MIMGGLHGALVIRAMCGGGLGGAHDAAVSG